MCVARHAWVAFGFRGGLAAEWIKLYVFDALNIHHVLMQLYNFSGKGSQHSLFTVAAIFSRGNRGRASVSQFPPAPMSSVDRKRVFAQEVERIIRRR